MLELTRKNLREHIKKMFPERQFIHRTGGKVNYFILSPRAQMIIASILALLLAWSLVTFVSLLVGRNPFTSTNKELRIKKAQYERYMIDLNAKEVDTKKMLRLQQEQFMLAAKNFEDKHNTIVSMITNGGILPSEDELDAPRYAQSEILIAPDVIDVMERQPRLRFGEHASLQTGTKLDDALVNLERDQNIILKAGALKMQQKIEKNRAILLATGLPISDILDNGNDGMGGPANEIQPTTLNHVPGEFLPQTDSIRARAFEVKRLENAIKATPLGGPIAAESYITSPYGRRKDPFTKRPSYHDGLDIASYKLAPIVATASGIVKFVGKKGGYGNMIVIDHGHGFQTRYAHLEKTYVKRGQKIEKGERIAGMGSTGRSTSTHLHYEIRFEGKSNNPVKFMKAGQYVQ